MLYLYIINGYCERKVSSHGDIDKQNLCFNGRAKKQQDRTQWMADERTSTNDALLQLCTPSYIHRHGALASQRHWR